MSLAEYLPVPVVSEGLVQLLPVGVASSSLLLYIADIAVEVEGDEPEVVAVCLGDLLWRCYSEVVPGVLEDILVLEHCLVHDNPRCFGGAAPKVQDQGTGCYDS